MIKGAEETKYIAQVYRVNEPLRWDLDGTVGSRKLFTIVPDVSQGTGLYQRVGDRISPVKMKVSVTYSWDNGFVGHYQPYVRQCLFTNKQIKSADVYNGISVPRISDLHKTIVRDYNDTTTYLTGSVGVDMFNLQKPINSNDWKLHKGSKTFLMTKQDGAYLNPVATTDHTNLQQVQPFGTARVVHKSFTVKCPKTFKYDPGATQPSSFCPLFGQYMGLEGAVDIAGSAANAGLGPYTGSPEKPTNIAILTSVRVELWFKDA